LSGAGSVNPQINNGTILADCVDYCAIIFGWMTRAPECAGKGEKKNPYVSNINGNCLLFAFKFYYF
jgi:hypothetical protein